MPLLFNTVLEILATAVRQKNKTKQKNKRNPEWKEVNLLLFTDGMIPYIENHKAIIKKLLQLINQFSKVARYKINIHNLSHFYTLRTMRKRN